MALDSRSGEPSRVVVAGGGVAGLEALIGLRTLAGERVELELISPETRFAYRPLSVITAIGGPPGPRIDIRAIADSVGAVSTTDSVAAVDVRSRTLQLTSGKDRHYDVLLLAPGARGEAAIPGAITFGAPGGARRFRRVLDAAEEGRVTRLVFAVPTGVGWPLAIYELALLSAERLRARDAEVEVTVVTPETAPLSVFGGRASGAVLEELEQRGVNFFGGLEAEELAWGELRARPGKVRIGADAVITLPRLRGPGIDGLPSDAAGFIPVDPHGLVFGLTDVYAAGDAIAFPIKQGGLAAQQADAAAESIAARLGAAVSPTPFRPVLRGMLLTGSRPRYLEADVSGGRGESPVSSTRPLWWPPAKIAGRYLAPYLTGQSTDLPIPSGGVMVDLEVAPGLEPVRAKNAVR